MTKQLSLKIQYISFLSMVLVVFIHSTNTNSTSIYPGIIENFVADGIARIAVPVFFGISGFLFFFNFKSSVSFYLSKYKKRFSSLFVPYIIWSAWGLLVFFLLQSLPFTARFFNNHLLRNYSYSKLVYTLLIDPLTYQLWFLRDLMVLVLLSPLIYLLLYYFRAFTLFACMFLWVREINLYIFLPESLLFFSIGCYLSIHAKALDKHLPYAWFASILWVVIISLKTYLQAQPHYNFWYVVFLKKVSIVIGIYAVWAVYDKLTSKSSSAWQASMPWLQFSFFLYAFHEPLLTILKKLLLFFSGSGNAALVIAYFVVPVLTIIITLYTGLLLKKLMPKVYYFVTGGR